MLVYLSGACLLFGLSTCWVLVYLLGDCLLVGCLSTCRVLSCRAHVYLLGACLRVRCLFTCWVLVYLLGACLRVGCLFTCEERYEVRAGMMCALYYQNRKPYGLGPEKQTTA